MQTIYKRFSGWRIFALMLVFIAAVGCGQPGNQGTAVSAPSSCPAGQVSAKGFELGQGMQTCGFCAQECTNGMTKCPMGQVCKNACGQYDETAPQYCLPE